MEKEHGMEEVMHKDTGAAKGTVGLGHCEQVVRVAAGGASGPPICLFVVIILVSVDRPHYPNTLTEYSKYHPLLRNVSLRDCQLKNALT